MNSANNIKSISIKGVLVGFLIMSVVFFISILLFTFAVAYLEYGGNFMEYMNENKEEYTLFLRSSNLFIFSQPVLILVPTILGGYVSARIAKKGIYVNALIFGILSLLVWGRYSMDDLRWFHFIHWAFAIPAALLGGHMAKRKVQALVDQNTVTNGANEDGA